ncbi:MULTISPECIES: DUF2971 domain-containing protein [Pseudomonas]|uniref:DUF2971 domain-containing protein n=1 Tax=Pseudomonas fulva TaxID=47880 RepID=A0A0D0I783_9PSED|nr:MULTISPECIES: DUF2971 domain-containing protein [Pseudomonas]KIP88762.1 hypothetical protein RU08_24645 [Pseudomonas fulva]
MNVIAYRYATADTFENMLQSQELWFSDLRKMNDWDEYAAGFRIANELIADEFPQYASILGEISPERMSDLFMVLICSFSSHGDCLSMWRGYGENGKGAAIGYDTHEIENHHLFARFLQKMDPVNGKVKFNSVIYSEENYREIIRQNITRVFSISSEADPEEIPLILEFRKKMLGSVLVRLCTLYKNDFFVDEREIRGFIEINEHADPYEVSKRSGDFGDSTVHKIRSDFKGIPSIKEVVLGPSYENSDEHVRSLLVKYGLPDVEIKRSLGTYRLSANCN